MPADVAMTTAATPSSSSSSCSSSSSDTRRRAHAAYVNHDKERGFVHRSTQYSQQYSQTYYCRLAGMRAMLLEAVRASDAFARLSVERVQDIRREEACVVIGVLHKEMPLKPSVLREYASDTMLPVPEIQRANYVSESDVVSLEDESGRAQLELSAELNARLVSGAVVAVAGREASSGRFVAVDICYPPAPEPLVGAGADDDAAASSSPSPDPTYVCLVSGICLAEDAARAQLLLDYLTGCAGTDMERVRRIARVIIAGSIGPTSAADAYLAALASSVPVDLVPGDGDPVNHALPQQPFHRALLPRASDTALTRCTNPHEASIGGRRFLGTGGQNTDNLQRFSSAASTLDALAELLRYRHLAPTAPDTLACYPFTERDPLIMERVPHVFFAGNAEAFGASTTPAGVRTLAVPRFDRTGTAVLLDLADDELRVSLLQFSSSGGGGGNGGDEATAAIVNGHGGEAQA